MANYKSTHKAATLADAGTLELVAAEASTSTKPMIALAACRLLRPRRAQRWLPCSPFRSLAVGSFATRLALEA